VEGKMVGVVLPWFPLHRPFATPASPSFWLPFVQVILIFSREREEHPLPRRFWFWVLSFDFLGLTCLLPFFSSGDFFGHPRERGLLAPRRHLGPPRHFIPRGACFLPRVCLWRATLSLFTPLLGSNGWGPGGTFVPPLCIVCPAGGRIAGDPSGALSRG